MKNQSEQPAPLDQESFNAIAAAFARLQALGNTKIAVGGADNTEAEREQLITYLATEMMNHVAEFLGAWQLCNLEYLPLLRSVQALAKRAGYFPARQPVQAVNPTNN